MLLHEINQAKRAFQKFLKNLAECISEIQIGKTRVLRAIHYHAVLLSDFNLRLLGVFFQG